MEQTRAKTAALILNGEISPDTRIIGDYIVCADGGYDRISERVKSEKLCVGVIIGDMDSISCQEGNLPKLIKYPAEKNYTDGELAIRHIIEQNYGYINIYGAFGGRPDFIAANLLLLPYARKRGVSARFLDSRCEVYYISAAGPEAGGYSFDKVYGKRLSIVPDSTLRVTSSDGLKYPLPKKFEKYSARGVSNTALKDTVIVNIKSGSAYLYITDNK